MQVGQALDRVGEGLLVEARVLGGKPVPEGFVVDGGVRECPRRIVWADCELLAFSLCS
jgi:hypothetical protein